VHRNISGQGEGQYAGDAGSVGGFGDGSQDEEVGEGRGRASYARGDGEGIEEEAVRRQ
jgi:hypothetical protein